MIVIPVILLVVAVAIAVVAGLAWLANLPGNGFIGIRAPEARKSKENWDITHRVAGPPWAVSALAFAGAGALAFQAIRPEASGWLWLWVTVAGLLGLAMLGIGGAIGSHTIALYDASTSPTSPSSACCSSGSSDGVAAAEGCGSDCGVGGCVGSSKGDHSGGGSSEGDHTGGSVGSSCSDHSVASAPRDPAADCGVTGGCGSCRLNGMCDGGGHATSGAPAVDHDALRRAARTNDAD